MKITDIKTYVTMPIEGLAWLLVEVETDEGVSGLGECTDYFANPHLVRGIEAVKPLVQIVALFQGISQGVNTFSTLFKKRKEGGRDV